MSLATLNSSGIQQSNPSLYQTIKDLYDQNLQLTNLVNSFGLSAKSDTNQLNINNPPILTNGQIQFPVVQNPSVDSNTLDDYSEKPWTPLDASAAGLVFATFDGSYIKIGRVVHLQGFVLFPATVSGLPARLSTPFITDGDSGLAMRFTNSAIIFSASMPGGQSFVEFYTMAGANITNAQLSGFFVAVSGTYRVTK